MRIISLTMHALLVKTSSLGDVVHNLPVVTDIQSRYPDAVIDWVVEETFADIPRLHPGVHRVIPVAIRRWRKQLLLPDTWRDIAEFRRELREDFYDVVLDTQGLIKSAVIAKQAELAVNGRRLGYTAEAAREPFAARIYDAGFAIPKNAHAVERNRWLAAAAFNYTIDSGLSYGIAAAPLIADWLPPAPYAVILTGTSRADKLWPEADWIALAQALNMPIVLPAGSAGERERAERLASQLPNAVVAPTLGIAELAGLLAGAQLVVGLDTGLTHLATALGKPTVAIFSGSDPALTGVLAPSPQPSPARGEGATSPLSPCGRGAGGEGAINLGNNGTPPTADEVIAAAQGLIR